MTSLVALCFILPVLVAHWDAQGCFMNECEAPDTFMEPGTEAFTGITWWATFKKYYELLAKKITLFLTEVLDFGKNTPTQ